jgi:hypothetical protein
LRKWLGLACLYMRPERTPKTLEDVQDAARFILEATEGKTLDDYSRDRLLRNAVERNFEVIGEAVEHLLRNDPDAMRLGLKPVLRRVWAPRRGRR